MEQAEQDQDHEDDDVLFVGSPLYESIVSSGIPMSDMEVEPQDGHCVKQEGLVSSEVKSRQPEVLKDKESFLTKVLMKVQDAFRFLIHLILPSSSESMDQEMNKLIVHDLFTARVLDDDDREFLEKYLKDVPTEPHAEQIDSWLTHIFQYGTRRKLCHRRETITSHVKAQLSFLTWMKKCLRLIQESELIARGFTLVSQKSPISLIEQSNIRGVTTRQCPELRKLLFYTAREAIMVCRERTKNIITNLPLSSELDSAGRYLAFQALESYGPCLQISANEEAELYDLTDGFSVAALKGMVQLCHLHQSEFIRRLILVFDYSSREPKAKHISSQHLREIVGLSTHLHQSSKVLEKSYGFHNSYLLKNGEPKEKGKVTDHSPPCEDIGVAVHSLDLHLQAALTRVRCLSSWLEQVENQNKSCDADILSHENLTQMMQPIKAELESCKSCWEEGINRIDKLQKRHSSDADVSSAERPTAASPSKTGSVKLVPVEDPIIVDQVFEAYTDEDHLEQRDYSWEQPLTAEDKAKKKREKEEALRLLKELKTVISVRSLEMEKREAYALQRFKNLTGTVDDPKEDSFTEGHTDKSGSSLDGSCEENSQDMDDLGGCSSIAENMSGIEDGSEINIPSSDVNKICCDINQVYSEVDKLNTEDNISNPSPNTDNFELVDSGGYSVKVDVQLTDDNKLKHATDGFDLPENEVLDHSVKDDCIDAAVITERARCNSNEISDADGAVPDIDNDSDHETDDLLNNESRNSTSKKSEYSLQGTSKYTGNRAIDETGAASDKHDDADEFLNISSGASQKSCNNSSFEDVENQERTNTAEDGSASDKSSSYVNLSNNTDVDSVYSAISYDNDNISLDVSPVKSSANDSSEDTEILELSNETVDKMSAENLDAESDMREDGNPLTLEERLEMIHGANLSFTSNIAALAAAKSRAFGLVEESTYGGETFGDMSDSDEDSSVQ